MKNIRGHVNTLDILKFIMRHDKIDRNNCTILITGRIGPTGKTWLCNELRKCGYKASELTPSVCCLLTDDGVNHVVVDEFERQVVIVLNEILPMYENKWCKVSDFSPDGVYTFMSRREAVRVLWNMVDMALEYGVVTRADFKELIDRESEFDDNKYGWTEDSIRKAQILRTRNGWIIEFPKSLPIM